MDNFDGMAVVPKFKANGLKFQQVADGTFTIQYFINELVRQEWYYFDGNEWNIKLNLNLNQEEADARMILQLNHASVGGL